MAKKQMIVNEDPSINFRVSPELKKWITNQSIKGNVTASNYLRNHLTTFMDGSLLDSEMYFNSNKSFVNTTNFLQLVTFVFAKRKNNKCDSSIEQLNCYISTIKEMEMEDIPRELINEFDKVLGDLIRVKKKSSKNTTLTFKFCKNSVFNYDLLENYLLNVLKPFEKATMPI